MLPPFLKFTRAANAADYQQKRDKKHDKPVREDGNHDDARTESQRAHPEKSSAAAEQMHPLLSTV